MGQLVIEVPKNINLKFSVKSAEIADEILRSVEKPKKIETLTLDLPYGNLDETNENEAVGIFYSVWKHNLNVGFSRSGGELR